MEFCAFDFTDCWFLIMKDLRYLYIIYVSAEISMSDAGTSGSE